MTTTKSRLNFGKLLKLKGKTAVFIDWANVYNWRSKPEEYIDLKKIYKYLRSYKEIKEINFYFVTDTHPASHTQIKSAEKIGLRVVTKPVKYLPLKDKDVTIYKRKCDFDLEIGLDCFDRIKNYDCFIFFSGDGDFATLYKRLIKIKKQVIVIYMYGHLGKEVWELKKGIYKTSIKKLNFEYIQKMTPNRRLGA